MMKAIYGKAILDHRMFHQEVDYIQFDSIYICIDKTENVSHIVYDSNLEDEFKESGFKVDKSEISLEIDSTSFNELAFSYYELQPCELNVFNQMAIKADENGLETYCKDNMNIYDAIRFWKLKIKLDDLCPVVTYLIPDNEAGALVRQLEKFEYELWDYHYRAPGETMECELRLDNVMTYYECLLKGDDFEDSITDDKEMLSESLEEYKARLSEENHIKFYNDMINHAEKLMIRADDILERTKHFVKNNPIRKNIEKGR